MGVRESGNAARWLGIPFGSIVLVFLYAGPPTKEDYGWWAAFLVLALFTIVRPLFIGARFDGGDIRITSWFRNHTLHPKDFQRCMVTPYSGFLGQSDFFGFPYCSITFVRHDGSEISPEGIATMRRSAERQAAVLDALVQGKSFVEAVAARPGAHVPGSGRHVRIPPTEH